MMLEEPTPTRSVVFDPPEDLSDDENSHDQLPSVEEVRTRALSLNAYADRIDRETQRRLRPPRDIFKIMFWFGVVLLLVSVIALVIVIISNSRAYNSQISQAEVEAFLIRSGIARKADLRDPSTAQSKAVSWLVNTDRSPVAVPQGGEADAYFLQRYIVLVLFYMTGGELWTNKWSMIEPREQVCNWNQVSKRDETYMYGVECEAGIATAIRIPATNLAGSLPNELGYLSSLKVVDLHDNALTGTLPRGLQRLTSCEYLALQHNQLLGTIPYWLGSLTNLEVLGLGDNVFDGAIPSTFQHLTNLVTLGLDDNGLDGDFSYLRFLKKMERLYLDTNSFEQPLATNFFAEMSDLKELDLSDNQLFGPIPYDMFEYTKLSILDLNSNSLEGQLPLGLYNNDVLELLSLSHNDLTGPILETISNLARLKHLDLAGNKFSGDIPNSITTMTNLRYLFVGDNPFSSGTIPGNLYHLSNLEDLSFKGSQRTGLIPDFFPQLQKLVFLDLDDNDFVGGIPESIGELTELRFLFLNRNDNLAGTVPVSVQDLPKLSIILLTRTSLAGDLGSLCNRPPVISQIEVASADCEGDSPELKCECCSICCSDSKPASTCRRTVYYGELDPIWEYSYERREYMFVQSTIDDGNT